MTECLKKCLDKMRAGKCTHKFSKFDINIGCFMVLKKSVCQHFWKAVISILNGSHLVFIIFGKTT